MAIMINRNDSPKFYLMLRDIYGNSLGVKPGDFQDLSFSIYKVSGVTRTILEGYDNVPIPQEYFYSEAQEYPGTIKNVTSAEKAEGYNFKLFPYVAKTEDGVARWTSPFSESNTTYEIAVNLSYYMKDDALDGLALLTRTLTISVQTRS